MIGFVVLAGCFSAAGLLLALLAFVFAERMGWAWLGLGAIGTYWLAFAAFLLISDHLARRRRQETGRP